MDRKIEKKKWYRRKKFWISAAAIVAVFVGFGFLLGEHSSKLRIEKDKISIDRVEEGLFQEYMATIGTVEPIRTIYLDAIVGGRVEEIYREEGSMLQKGEKILRLSNPDLHLRIMNSESELAERENMLRNTEVEMEKNRLQLKRQLLDLKYRIKKLKRDYENNKKFYNQELISKEDFINSKEDYEYAVDKRKLLKERQKQDSVYRAVQVAQLRNSLERMRKNLKLVNKKLEALTIKAPVKGQLGLLDAEIGEAVKSGQRLGMINVLDNFKVTAQIDEHYIAKVNTHLTASFDFEGKNYELEVIKVYPEVRKGRFQIDMRFQDKMPDDIRTGQTFRIKLELGKSQEALLIPRGSFYQSTGGQSIFVVDESGNFATKRQIKIGRQNPRYYEVLSGLQPGEKVITSSYENFGDVEQLILKQD